MQEFTAITVSVINIIISFAYLVLLIKKKIKPALAMWLFFSLAVSMSLITYLKEGNYGFWDNALNTADLFMTIFVTISIFIFGDKSTKFDKFDLVCLGAVGLIVVFWIITQNHLATNLGIQLILIIAYFPVVKRMLSAKENTESFFIWILLMIAPFISLISSKGALATIYAVRAILCTGLLLSLMIRIDAQNKKAMRKIQ
jgi:hypothetical protein